MTTFDTLRAAQRLREAGASEPIAGMIAETIREAVAPLAEADHLATREDLQALRADIYAALFRLAGFAVAVAAVAVAVAKLT